MNLWWKNKPKRITTEAKQPAALYRQGFTASQFRERPDFVEDMRKFFTGPVGQAALSALYAETPKGYTADPALQLGRVNGWRESVMCLESLAEPMPDPAKEPEADWGVDETEFPNKKTT